MTMQPRVAIYGTGQYILVDIRTMHDKGWPIVAAGNRVGVKVGQDLGTLAGIGPLGITAQGALH